MTSRLLLAVPLFFLRVSVFTVGPLRPVAAVILDSRGPAASTKPAGEAGPGEALRFEAPPPPRAYGARRTGKPIEIDGEIYGREWEAAPWSEDFVDIQGADAPEGNGPSTATRTRMKMLWDDEYLYIAAEMSAKNWAIEAHQTQRNSVVFSTDSDFEVFLDADGTNYNYKELELSAKNTVWNLLLDKPYSVGGSEHSARVANASDVDRFWEVSKQKTAAKMYGKIGQPNPEGKWVAEIALAHSETLDRTSGRAPSVGSFWRINFSRVEKKGALNWVWSPQMTWSPTLGRPAGVVGMHFPDTWGYVHFQDAVVAEGSVGESFDDTWQDPQWPLKAAASQLFFAEDQAKSAVGRPLSVEALVEKGWLTGGIASMRPEVSLAVQGGVWSATVQDSLGCQARIDSEHRLDVSCPGALALAIERQLLPTSWRGLPSLALHPLFVPALLLAAALASALAFLFWYPRRAASASASEQFLGKRSGPHQA